MSSRTSDVSLVIRAKDEAQKTLDAVAAALNKLFVTQEKVAGSADKTGNNIADLAATLATLDKAYAGLTSNANSAEAAFNRQKAAINGQKESLQNLQAQAAAAAAVLDKLNAKQAMIGPQQGGPKALADQIKLVAQEYDRLERQAGKLATTIATQENALGNSASSLQRIGSTANAVEAAVAKARIELEAQTRAYEKNSAAARANAEIKPRIEAVTGVTGTRAIDAGATFSALAAREEAKALKDAADAYNAFEARVKQGVAAMRDAEAAEAKMGAEADALRAKLDPVASATARAAAQIQRYQELLAAGKITPEIATAGTNRTNQELAATVAGLNGSAKAAADAAANTAKLSAEADALRAKLDPARAAQEGFNAELRRYRELLDAGVISQREYNKARQDVGARAQSARDDLTGGAAAAKAANDQAVALQRLRDSLDPVAVIERNLAAQQAILNQGFRDGKITADELSKSTALLNANAERAKQAVAAGQKNQTAGFLGLRGYELTNLGYQLNDVATQLASGTSLAQTLGQQGGQILQLFPRVGSAVFSALKGAPLLLGSVAAGVIALGTAISHASDQNERLRQVTGILTLSADGFTSQAKAVRDAENALDRYGLTADQALKIVRLGVRDGLDAAQITKFGMAAKDMADILGVDAVTAANQLSTAFSGGFAAIQALDKATNLYTASQLETIRTLFKQGEAQKAVALATDIAYAALDKAADKARGPWAEAMLNLSNAWGGFLDRIADTSVFKGAIGAVEELANRVASAFGTINATGADAVKNQLLQMEARYSGIIQLTTKNGKTQYAAPNDDTRYKGVADEMNRLKAQYDALTAAQAKTAATSTAAATAESNLQQKKIDQIKEEIRLRQDAAGKVTSQADVDRKVLAAREKALADIQTRQGAQRPSAGLTAAQNAFADQAATEERVKLNRELADYQKQQAEAAQQAANAEERSLKAFVGRVVKAESGGDPNAKNPNSTATGTGQFIESTWLDLFRKYFPAQAANLGRDAILELRKDAEVSKTLIELYARENAAALKKSGNAVTEANLQLAHFLGAGSANKVLKAAPGTPLAGLLDARAVAANPKILGNGATVDSVKAYAARRARAGDPNSVGDTAQAQLEGEAALREVEKDRLDTQNKFNAKIDDENEKRQLGIDALRAEAGLRGEALIAEQKRAAVAAAVLAKQQEIDKLNADRATRGLPAIEFSDAQRAEIENTTRALFDYAHARDVAAAKREAVDRPVSDLSAQRDAVLQQINLGQQSGQKTNGLEATYKSLTEQINAARDAQIALYESIIAGGDAAAETNGTTVAALEAQVQAIRNAKAESQQLGVQFIETGRQINESIANGAVTAFDQFAQSLVEGRSVFVSLRTEFLQFALNFLRELEQMIVKQTIFNAVAGAGGAGTGGFGGFLSALIGGIAGGVGGGSGGTGAVYGGTLGGIYHGGGIAGSAVRTRTFRPEWTDNVLRYHSGGVAGLLPNEVPAVLEKGEEVLTKSDPRHRANGGGAAAPQDLKIVNLFDPAQAASQLLGTRAGQKAILNMISDNPAAFKSALGV